MASERFRETRLVLIGPTFSLPAHVTPGHRPQAIMKIHDNTLKNSINRLPKSYYNCKIFSINKCFLSAAMCQFSYWNQRGPCRYWDLGQMALLAPLYLILYIIFDAEPTSHQHHKINHNGFFLLWKAWLIAQNSYRYYCNAHKVINCFFATIDITKKSKTVT